MKKPVKKKSPPTGPPPLLSQALTLLRETRRWSQTRLGQVSRVPSSMLSDYETGRKNLTPQRFESLAAALGYTLKDVEEAISFLGVLGEGPPGSFPAGLSPADVRKIEHAAATVGRVAREKARDLLATALQAAQTDEARRHAEEAWKTLKPYSPHDRVLLVESLPAFQTWAVCELVCDESARAAAADARRAMDLAKLALQIAERFQGEESWRKRVQGYAWAFLGNARRVASQLPAADQAFGQAWSLWAAGADSDPGWLHEGRLFDLEASLRRDQRKFPEALRLLDRALALARTEAEGGRLLANRAATLELMGKHELALESIEKAIPLVNQQREPRLLCVLLFNQAVALGHLGRYTEAAELLPVVRRMAIELRNGLDLIRVLWLEGRVAKGHGRKAEAIDALRQVRAEFTALKLTYDSALSTLELASLYLEEGRAGEVKALAREMAPIFKAQGVHEEALAALRLFREAVEQETVTLELTNRLVDYLERARHDPGLRFAA